LIRKLYLDEYEMFMGFLNRAYGFSPGAFERGYPHIYRPGAALCETAYVVDCEGEIVSHVGLYPIEVVVQGVAVPIAGIGAVGTKPSERGKGHMTRLLYHVIDEMRAQGYPLSWLGGDRQRYSAFGWERAGLAYDLRFSRRALDRCRVEPVPIEARRPEDAVSIVERYQSLAMCHVRRPNLSLQLRKEGLRLWFVQDGYAIVGGPLYGPLSVLELISASGQELGMILALLDWTDRAEISWEVPACDGERLARLLPGVSHWRAAGWEMYRIVDLAALLGLMKRILARRAAPIRDFELAIGIREHDRIDIATIAVRGGDVEIMPGRNAKRYIEWSAADAARLILGGPPIGAEARVPGELAALLPLPAYVPPLDHV
jgi:predicted N-acetyltransferase YhbS